MGYLKDEQIPIIEYDNMMLWSLSDVVDLIVEESLKKIEERLKEKK